MLPHQCLGMYAADLELRVPASGRETGLKSPQSMTSAPVETVIMKSWTSSAHPHVST